MDSSISQIVYRSMFATHCKRSNMSQNVSLKIALFEKLKYKTEVVPSKTVEEPKQLKFSQNLELLKAYSMFNGNNTKLNNESILDSSFKSEKVNIFCSTPRDTQLEAPDLLLSPALKSCHTTAITQCSSSSSTVSSDAGLGDDCSTEVIIDTNNISDSVRNKALNKKYKQKRNLTISSTSSDASGCQMLLERGKKVKENATKLNKQRKNLIENDKLIR